MYSTANGTCLQKLFKLYARINCARRAREWMAKNSTLLKDCKCFPPCDEVVYDVSYSLAKWPASGFVGDGAYFDILYVKNFVDRFENTTKYDYVKSYFDDSKREARMKNFARLNVYVADSNVIKMHESWDYNTYQFLSDVGGLTALWMGISVITLMEIIELLCDIIKRFSHSPKKSSDADANKMEEKTIKSDA